MNQLILDSRGDQLFYRITNSDGKVWYIPDANCRLALQLYQPSSINGKLLKSCFPLFKRFSLIRNLLGISSQKFTVQTSLFNLLCELFKVKNVEIALFCGTPSVHQKITMQITDGLNIVGYCKISEKKEVKALFKHEEDIFKTLHGNGFTNTPQCLYNARLKDETYIFAQTTTKTKNSKILHQLSAMHWDFLSQLHQKTKTSLPFEKSDFYEALNLLKQNLSYLSVADAKSVSAAIAMVEKHYEGKEIMFSFYHADFTPWNMFVEKGELFVFDWEYAKRTFPPFLDAFHFLTQVCIFEQHKDAEGIMANYRANRHIFAEYFDNPDFSYQCYLLGIISFYFDRDKDDFNKSNIQIWAALLRLLQEHA